MSVGYTNPYGTWAVTTEGDCEGRSITNLGTFTGYVDEIALYLANKSYYSLRFKAVKNVNEFPPSATKVNVSFDIDSNTWNLGKYALNKKMSELFNDRPVTINNSNYYASFEISTTDSDAEKKIKRAEALNKLSDEEKEILGLN